MKTPTPVEAVARDLGLHPDLLDWHVGADHLVEPTDDIYQDAVAAAADCLASGVCSSPYGFSPYGCGCAGDLHRITCPVVTAGQRHAMVNGDGDVFYPDGDDDAAYFAAEHGAWIIRYPARTP